MTQPPTVPGQPPQQPYPPQPQPQYGPPGPPAQPVVVKGASPLKIVLIVLGCVAGVAAVCLVISLLGGFIGGSVGDSARSDLEVQLVACDHNGFAYVATVEVRNRGERPESGVVRVEFIDTTDARLAEGTEYISSLAAGQTAREEVQGFGPDPTTAFRCVLRD